MSRAADAPKAIITDGFWRKSLSAVRSLGKAGFRVSVLGNSALTTGFWSRYTSRRIVCPSAAQNKEAFGRGLLGAIAEEPGAVLLPMEDASLEWVSKNRGLISQNAHFLIPPEESIATALDKGKTLRLANELGLPCPETFEPASADEFASRVLSLETGSFVVKPRSSSGAKGISYGDSKSRESWLRQWAVYGPLLIQKRIPFTGRAQGVAVLMDQEGQVAASFAYERIQQYPNTGGPSTDRQSIYAPALVEMSVQLLKKLSWRGVAMVEWKSDPRDKTPKLMEINPRFWGSLELAVRSGVNFPLLYAQAARGEKLETVSSYKNGVRCRWMIPGEMLRWMEQTKMEREAWGEFLKGLPSQAEEWDPLDLMGFFSSLVCTGMQAFNPYYWQNRHRSSL